VKDGRGEAAFAGAPAVGGRSGAARRSIFEALAAELDLPVVGCSKASEPVGFGQPNVIFRTAFRRVLKHSKSREFLLNEAERSSAAWPGAHEPTPD